MKALTKKSALTLRHGAHLIHSRTLLRARVNGKCQTWVTRPNEWRLPCKYGLKQCFDITQDNDGYWFAQP
jgi:hypothetical protein